MTRPPAISVVIPHFNQSRLLSEAIEALERTPANIRFEILVVDDGSAAGAPLHLREQFGHVEVIAAGHGGPAAARNIGIAKAKSAIVAFTDADCRPGERWLSSILDAFERFDDVDAITGPVIDVTSASWIRPLHLFFQSTSILDHRPQEFVYRGATVLGMIGANFAARKGALISVGGFDEAFPVPGGEDYDLAFTLQRNGHRVMFVESAEVGHAYPAETRLLLRRWYRYGIGKQIFANKHDVDLAELHLLSAGGVFRSARAMPGIARSHFDLERCSVSALLAETCFQLGARSARTRIRASNG